MFDDDTPPTTDVHGTPLADGDSIYLTKDLKLKGTKTTLKQGTVYKIRLTSNPKEVAAKDIILLTEFIKKKPEK